jgi:O-succinylbenzoic acid--CoA ligase
VDRFELARALGAEPAVGEPPAEAGGPAHVVCEREPAAFMAAFAAAVARGGPVFLADPAWGETERARLEELRRMPDAAGDGRGWLMIASGGTGGGLKFARHDEETLGAAVRGFGAHFGLTRVHAVGVLPLHHVSGLMAWLRCGLTGGTFTPWEWKKLEAGKWPEGGAEERVISLVPTQLQRLLTSPAAPARLRGFRVIFVGGGPVWPELADAAARAELPVSLGYGMTETAAMVTALRPDEFLRGDRSSGTALPHARVRCDDAGTVHVAGESLARGYWPERSEARELATDDLGCLDAAGHLHVLGRRDAMIITGGKKVPAAEVEAALRASGEFSDVAVLGVPDAEWGEAVVACFLAGGRAPDTARAAAALAPHRRPKRFVPIAPADWPRNAQGKLSRAALRVFVIR